MKLGTTDASQLTWVEQNLGESETLDGGVVKRWSKRKNGLLFTAEKISLNESSIDITNFCVYNDRGATIATTYEELYKIFNESQVNQDLRDYLDEHDVNLPNTNAKDYFTEGFRAGWEMCNGVEIS